MSSKRKKTRDTLQWTDNPTYAGRTPEPLTPGCHDRSHMLDIQCRECGMIDHVHETQIAAASDDTIIGMRCSQCRSVREVPVTFLREGFAEARKRGWIA